MDPEQAEDDLAILMQSHENALDEIEDARDHISPEQHRAALVEEYRLLCGSMEDLLLHVTEEPALSALKTYIDARRNLAVL